MDISVAEKERVLTRRQFLGLSGLSVVGLALYSSEIARHELDIVQQTIVIPGLPDSFRGFRIVQVSDIHFKEFTEAFFVKLVVHEVNGLKPDLVALTGDFVSYGPIDKHRSVPWFREVGELLAKIQCPQRYAVLGNHDCIVNEAAALDALTTHNIPVLNNAAIPLERDGKRIWLAGIADALAAKHGPDFEKAIPKTAHRDDERVILMAHEPDILPTAVKHNVDLMLSGHTHGGQVRLPFLPPIHLPPLGRKYIEGHFQLGRTQLYVNRGIGTVDMPFRFNCPPEITVLTLA
jgi:predicted MPP superfamily phosphohydrolase